MKIDLHLHIPSLAVLGMLMMPLTSANLMAATGAITNTEGRQFEGKMTVVDDATLRLDAAVGAGAVSYLFSVDKIQTIEFYDAEAIEAGLEAISQGQFATAVEVLRPVHRQRSPFFRLYPSESLVEPSLALGEAYFETGRYTEAVGLASALLGSGFAKPEVHAAANQLMLRSFFKLERWEETEILAKRWCEEHHPAEDSALGWWILGEARLAAGDWEAARWISLLPITFSSQLAKPYLEHCYPVVIQSWLSEGNPKKAVRVYREFRERKLPWPEEKSALQASLEEMLGEGNQGLDPSPSDPELEIPQDRPEMDLNLPLESVRKITAKTETPQAP